MKDTTNYKALYENTLLKLKTYHKLIEESTTSIYIGYNYENGKESRQKVNEAIETLNQVLQDIQSFVEVR